MRRMSVLIDKRDNGFKVVWEHVIQNLTLKLKWNLRKLMKIDFKFFFPFPQSHEWWNRFWYIFLLLTSISLTNFVKVLAETSSVVFDSNFWKTSSLWSKNQDKMYFTKISLKIKTFSYELKNCFNQAKK